MTANSLTVSGGVATLVTGANNQMLVGQLVSLYDNADPANVLDGACVPVTATPTAQSFSVSATVGGVTLPDGTYAPASGTWSFLTPSMGQYDGSLIGWLNRLNGNPLNIVASYAKVGITSEKILALTRKALASGAQEFDIAVIDGITNDIVQAASTAGAALAAAVTGVANMTTAIQLLLAAGKKVIHYIPPPVGATQASVANINPAMRYVRESLLAWGQSLNKEKYIPLDVYGETIDTSTTTDGLLASYELSSDKIHLTTYGCYQVAKNLTALGLMERILGYDKKVFARCIPSGITHTAWATSTAYSVGDVRKSNGNVYRCTSAITSSDTAPTGTGSAIADDDGTWAYVDIDKSNLLANGDMSGTGGTNSKGTIFTGTVPDSWNLLQASETISDATTTGNATKYAAAAGKTSTRHGGKAWELTFTCGANNDQIGLYQSLSNTLIFSGKWYRAGFTLTAIADSLALKNARIEAGIAPFATPFANRYGNNTNSIPMLQGDQIDIWTEPFYYDGSRSSAMNFLIYIRGNIGTISVQISDVFFKQVESPL